MKTMKEYEHLKTLLRADQWERALDVLETLLKQNPLASNLHTLRGDLLQLVSRRVEITDIESAYARAVELDSQNIEALFELEKVYTLHIKNSSLAQECSKKRRELLRKYSAESA